MKLTLKANRDYIIKTQRGTSWVKIYRGKEFLAMCAEMTAAYQFIYRETNEEYGVLDDSSFERKYERMVEV